MAAVITVAQQKGGAGKTTLAATLAAAFAERHRVGLLDIDPQRSLMRWHGLRRASSGRRSLQAIAAADPSGWRLASEADRLRRECDVVLVDSPPQVDHDARRAIRTADLVLVPVQPSVADLWAAKATLDLVRSERRPVRLVLNRVAGGERATAVARALVAAELGTDAKDVLIGCLGNRSSYAQAFAQGMGVTEAWPRAVASQETRALAKAVAGLVSLSSPDAR